MGSSSRKKSTSKKRSSKLSSKVRSMKKSKKTRSRKHGHRHRHDTSSDDDSVSSLSISSPSNSYSDGDSMSPRPKRRSVKKREKHASKTSSSRKDNRDSKKRKKSKKNDDPKPRKKVKRDVKISSASSDSHSCSSSDSERSEDERVKKRSREQKKGKRDRWREKSVSPLRTSRSVSPSSVGYQDEIQAIGHSEETFVVEKKSRRLKSIIVIPEKSIEEDEPEKDMHFEEIVNDRDDYPYKSSSGEGGREGSSPSPPGASAYGQHIENDGFTSDNNGMSELTAKGIEVERVNNETKELEAILKQKALENLEKFRGARKTSVKPAADQKDVNSGDQKDVNIGDQKDVNSGDHNGSVRTEINKFKLADSTISDRDIPRVETTETPSLNNQPGEANEDTPKFQEKPISKMRGGEMVQTKYQIYIPKRAPRKFNR